jgi:glucokinase
VQAHQGLRALTGIAALDVGGTHVSAARVDPVTGATGAFARTPFAPDADRETLIRALSGAAAAVAPGADALGVAVPGPFDYERGVCTIAGVSKLEALHGADLRAILASAAGLPPAAVVFVNDAEAFLLGEARLGNARGHARCMGITLGTGLGSAFAADGEIVRDGPLVPPGGEVYPLRFRGAPVEERLSARGLLARAPGFADVRALADAARQGDGAAGDACAAFRAELAEFLEPHLRRFGATCLVVGGSISRAWDLVAPDLSETVVTPASDVDLAPLRGAAAHAAARRVRGPGGGGGSAAGSSRSAP